MSCSFVSGVGLDLASSLARIGLLDVLYRSGDIWVTLVCSWLLEGRLRQLLTGLGADLGSSLRYRIQNLLRIGDEQPAKLQTLEEELLYHE